MCIDKKAENIVYVVEFSYGDHSSHKLEFDNFNLANTFFNDVSVGATSTQLYELKKLRVSNRFGGEKTGLRFYTSELNFSDLQ